MFIVTDYAALNKLEKVSLGHIIKLNTCIMIILNVDSSHWSIENVYCNNVHA